MLPSVSFSSPTIIFSSVVFPCPFPPTIPILSPLRISKFCFLRIGLYNPSNFLVASLNSTMSLLALSTAFNDKISALRFFGTLPLRALSSFCIRSIILCFAEIDLSYLLALFICCKAPIVFLIFFSVFSICSPRDFSKLALFST